MTQVKEVKNEGLKREFTFTIARAEVEAAFDKRLQEIGSTAKISGFRPGKAPLHIIRQRFGDEARTEVLEKVITLNVEKTLTERKLRPAQQPKVELIGEGGEQDLEFKLSVEVLPQVKPMDFAKLSFERPVAEVEEKTIDEAITRVAKAVNEPELITEKRGAKMGDVVVLDFDGKVGGVAYPGMKAEGHKLELGSKSFIDTFEEQLVGLKAGDKKDVEVTFPENYHAEILAGETAVFAVEIKELRAHGAIKMDDELAKKLGFDTIGDLRKRVAEDIGADYARISRAIVKRYLMDKLDAEHKFEIPEGMAAAEFDAIWKQFEKDKDHGNLPEKEAKKSDDELKAEYKEIAARRVRLGLLLAEVAEEHKIEVTGVELRTAMMAEANRFPGQQQAVVDYYTKTPGAFDRLRAPILEEKVVDFVLALAKITDKKVSADELVKIPETMD